MDVMSDQAQIERDAERSQLERIEAQRMGFTLPNKPEGDVAAYLRDLEQNCPKTTPKDVRAALIVGAQEIERWRTLASDTARQLEEAANLRISQMDSHSRADEKQRGVKNTLLELARRFRELA